MSGKLDLIFFFNCILHFQLCGRDFCSLADGARHATEASSQKSAVGQVQSKYKCLHSKYPVVTERKEIASVFGVSHGKDARGAGLSCAGAGANVVHAVRVISTRTYAAVSR